MVQQPSDVVVGPGVVGAGDISEQSVEYGATGGRVGLPRPAEGDGQVGGDAVEGCVPAVELEVDVDGGVGVAS